MSPPEDAVARRAGPEDFQSRPPGEDRSLTDRLRQKDAEIERLQQELARAREELASEHARVAILADYVCEGIILSDQNGKVLFANDRIAQLTGLSAQELIAGYGTRVKASDAEHHEVPKQELPLFKALKGSETRDEELTFHLTDRDVTILASGGPVCDVDGRVQGGLVVYQDISRRAWAARRAQLLNVLSELLSSGKLEKPQFDQIARMVGEAMGAWSVLALRPPGAEKLEIVSSYHPDSGCAEALAELANTASIRVGLDPGMGAVAFTGKPMLVSELPEIETLQQLDPRAPDLFRRLGGDSLLILPLTARGNTLGVLMLVSLPHGPRFTGEDLEYSSQLVGRIAATLDNVQLLTDLRNKEWRMRMLAELSRQFANSLDLQRVLRTVAAQVAEALGDWSTIGLLDEQGQRIRPAAVYHRDASRHAALQRLVESYPVEVGEGISGRVVASQTPVFLERLTEADLRMAARGQGARDLLQWLQPTSYICAPLSVRGKPLGYLDVACSPDSGRKLGESELQLIQELADRAASAIQNAQLYEELQAVIRAKDDWLSVASHELKTPLTPLQVLLQLMERRVRRNEQVTIEQIERCLTQVSKLIKLINELLDVSKLEVGQLELKPELVELRPIVEEVVNGFRDSSELHEIILEPGGDGLTIAADKTRIEQVLVNLIHNAIKYSPEGGKVNIHVQPDELRGEPAATVTVIDQGIGIPELEQSRLFQRYFRGSNVPERNFGGLGLGLWISYEIVHRHNGLLWAESQPGVGSRFMVTLPLSNRAELAPVDERPVVLLVDDDEAILEAAADCLREEGYQVVTARNGQSAMALLARQRPNVVLMDLMMPLMDGWELMRRIRALPEGHTIKVILVSATHDLSARAAELGAWDFLTKPFSLEEMLVKVARATERAEAAS